MNEKFSSGMKKNQNKQTKFMRIQVCVKTAQLIYFGTNKRSETI